MDYKANLIEIINDMSNLYTNMELELMDIAELTRLINELTYAGV